MQTRWTPEQEALLRDMIMDERTPDEIAAALGKTLDAIKSRRQRLRIKLTPEMRQRALSRCGYKGGVARALQIRARPKQQGKRKMLRPSLDLSGRPLRALEPISVLTAAATFLGKWYRPVFRADLAEKPGAVPHGMPTAYRVGNLTVPALEMLDMARGKGFEG